MSVVDAVYRLADELSRLRDVEGRPEAEVARIACERLSDLRYHYHVPALLENVPDALQVQVALFLLAGEKIEAVKMVRRVMGVTLMQAKDHVDLVQKSASLNVA